MNLGKTVAMEIKEQGKRIHLDKVKVMGNEIEWVNEYTYLGIKIQNDLKWEK